MEKDSISSYVLTHLKTKDKIINFLKNILKFYTKIEFLSDSNDRSFSKLRYRYFITKFLLNILQ